MKQKRLQREETKKNKEQNWTFRFKQQPLLSIEVTHTNTERGNEKKRLLMCSIVSNSFIFQAELKTKQYKKWYSTVTHPQKKVTKNKCKKVSVSPDEILSQRRTWTLTAFFFVSILLWHFFQPRCSCCSFFVGKKEKKRKAGWWRSTRTFNFPPPNGRKKKKKKAPHQKINI